MNFADIPSSKPIPAFTTDMCDITEETEVTMFMRPTAARVRENAHQELPRQPHSLGLTLGAWQRTHGSRCSQHGLWFLAVGLPRSSAPHSALGQLVLARLTLTLIRGQRSGLRSTCFMLSPSIQISPSQLLQPRVPNSPNCSF